MFSSSNSWQLLLKGKLVHYLININTSVYLSAPIILHCPANKIFGKSIVYLFMASSTLIALLRYERETEREPSRYALERVEEICIASESLLMASVVIPERAAKVVRRDLRSFAVNIEILYPYLFGGQGQSWRGNWINEFSATISRNYFYDKKVEDTHTSTRK